MTVNNSANHHNPTPQFPTHNAPRVWLITAGDSPIGISLARSVLSHGDYVVSGIIPADFEKESTRSEDFKNFLADVGANADEGWRDRLRIVGLDVRYVPGFFFLLLESHVSKSIEVGVQRYVLVLTMALGC